MLDFLRVGHEEPHVSRGRQILAAHPELRTLAGPYWPSAIWVVSLVAVNVAAGVYVSRFPWYVWLPAAYIVGATIDHALWVLIHETAHCLIFQRRSLNRAMALIANIPMVVPAAMSFCKYHLLHHRHLGEHEFDADLAGPLEARVVGKSTLWKALWMACMALILGVVRPNRLKRVPILERWSIINTVTQLAAMGLLVWFAGPAPLKYLAASSALAVGLHPLGARWIQEHYVFAEGQETYSYYGPLNRVAFNAGYHNEHHDLMTIPWPKLPKIRATAREFYDGMYAHYSWSRLLYDFITDRRTTLFSRLVRPDRTD